MSASVTAIITPPSSSTTAGCLPIRKCWITPRKKSLRTLINEKSDYFTKEEFVKLLRKNKESIALSLDKPLETMQVIKRDAGGYVEELQIGNVNMSGDEFAHIFSLKSPNFQVEESEGKIHIITKGIGHGFGVSVYGSILLAENGKSYTQILQHYYLEVYLEPLWEE